MGDAAHTINRWRDKASTSAFGMSLRLPVFSRRPPQRLKTWQCGGTRAYEARDVCKTWR